MSGSVMALIRRLEMTYVRQEKALEDTRLQLESARAMLQVDLPLGSPRTAPAPSSLPGSRKG
jgi:hypothetical protein